ncbi:tetratricopeptide repeat protein [Planctomicrobium piriforme]|uniref:Tetratricopeptide repeat-containing protein n=1 Tax=Planctomicrobium piriforme TaxID=1576369 RepID=A0A1I3BD55_9PLAN|nr:tetratricopeptide repeat protein [Planctomicrobium piriforme]SFH60237.1 Tetratricopeptide repeat-containing protein [Planctomicrobium piriforme]
MTSPAPSADALCGQARACLKQRDVAAAVAYYEQAIALDPHHIAAHEGLAAVCFAKKDNDRAVELFKRVVALDPRRNEANVNLGAAYNRRGDYLEAIKTLRHALARDRLCAAAYYNLGFAQRGAKQLSMAVSAFKEAIRLDPSMWEAYVNLGQLLLEMKNPSQALLNFERALQLRPDSTRARTGATEARNRIDAGKKAISPFGRLVDLKEVEKKAAQVEATTRTLTAEERFQERCEVHHLAKDNEQSSVLLLNHLKQEMGPILLSLNRLVTEKQNPALWSTSFDGFQASFRKFQAFADMAARKLDELQRHEHYICGPADGAAQEPGQAKPA